MDLSRIDLNLLKVLDALIEERSVTRAGERLGRTQPAVSNALARLRTLTGDRLLVRSPGGLALTPRAEAMREPLKEFMRLAETCLGDNGGFEPRTASGILTVAMPNRLALPVLPRLARGLAAEAPGLSLQVVTADREPALALLTDGVAEIAIGWHQTPPPHCPTEALFEDRFVCLLRKGHLLAEAMDAPDLERLLGYPHVLVSAIGRRRAIFDEMLAERGLERKVAVALSNYAAVPFLLEASDMVGVFLERSAAFYRDRFSLETRPLPIDLPPIATSMAWHRRNEEDARNRWVRQLIRANFGRA